MMENLSLRQLNKPELFEKFCSQLYKDYELGGCGEFAPFISGRLEDLQLAVAQSLAEIAKRPAAYQSLLYRVDISEQQIHKAIESKKDMPLLDIVAELIIKRVLQKVILKQLYASDDNNNETGH